MCMPIIWVGANIFRTDGERQVAGRTRQDKAGQDRTNSLIWQLLREFNQKLWSQVYLIFGREDV